MSDFEKKKEHLAHITNSPSKRSGAGRPSAVTLMDLKDALSPKRKRRSPVARSFGSDSRITFRPWAEPGPGAYDVPRDGDPEPVWAPDRGQQCVWSTRTSNRPVMGHLSGNSPLVGLGHTDTSFKPGGTSPIFGHPGHDIIKPNYIGTDPARYTLPSSLCRDSPVCSMGNGKRPALVTGLGQGPGPVYDPKLATTSPMISFSKSVRTHQSDLIDPDEPPGPGSHTVRRDPKVSDKPSAGLPKDQKLKHVPGLGPAGPGPGGSSKVQSFLEHRGCTIGIKLPMHVEESPGPGDTAGADPFGTDLGTRRGSPSWGSLVSRSSVRKPPWQESSQSQAVQLSPGQKLIRSDALLKFKPGGPRWSMMPKREEKNKNLLLQSESEAMVMTTSLG